MALPTWAPAPDRGARAENGYRHTDSAQGTRRESPAALLLRLRRAWMRLRSRWVLVQSALVLLIGLALAIWVSIPDTNTLEIGLTVLLAVGGTVCALWTQSLVLIQARRRALAVRPERGAVLLLALLLVYQLWSALIESGQLQDASRAAYFAARFGGHGQAGLALLQQGLWWLLRACFVLALLPFAMEGCARRMRDGWLHHAAEAVRQPGFWILNVSTAAVASGLAEALLAARPDLPPPVLEVLGLAKGTLIAGIEVLALCLVLSITSTYLRDWERATTSADMLKGVPVV